MKFAKYMLCVLTFVFCNSAIAAGNAKTTICHNPDKKGGNTIAVSSSAVQRHMDKHGDYVGLCEMPDYPGAGIAIPEAIEFDSATLVTQILVQVPVAWLTDPNISLDIEITGLNGGYIQHGTDLIDVVDSNVFSTDGVVAHTVLDWTADVEPRHANEVYTVCIQALRNTTELIGPRACVDFSLF
jgi:hypothetical protein